MTWRELASDAGLLLEVRGCSCSPGRFRELAFVFEHGAMHLTPIDDTDEIAYRDAFQMRLLDLASREERTQQFEVAASAIDVREVCLDR